MPRVSSKTLIKTWFIGITILLLVLTNAILGLEKFSNTRTALNNQEIFGTETTSNDRFAGPFLDILNDIYFVDETHGWIIGNNGKILYSNNGGRSWQFQACPVSVNLMNLAMIDPYTGWAAGENGTILHWDGNSWQLQHSHKNLRIFEIHFFNRHEGIALAGNYILRTNDGGHRWTYQPVQEEQTVVGAHVTTIDTGWFYGGSRNSNAVLLKQQPNRPLEDLTPDNLNTLILDMDFANSRQGWMVGFGNNVLHTSDGGNSWNKQLVNSERGLIYKVDFTDSLNGWLITQSGEIFHTSNGGTHWELNKKINFMLFGLQFLNKTTGWAVGSQGAIFSTHDGGKNWQKHRIENGLYLSYFKGAYCIIAREHTRFAKLNMHIPVVATKAAPIAFKLDKSTLSRRIHSFRTLEKGRNNWLAEITFKNLAAGDSIYIPWESWILKQSQPYTDLPDSVDIRRLRSIPDSVQIYLNATKIAQSNHPIIREQALVLKGAKTNIRTIVQQIIDYTGNSIAYQGGNDQDAVSALRNRTGVCTGKANIAIAMLRALGIPARTLMVANTHFIIEYFLPDYGWVRAESTSGIAVHPNEKNTVMWTSTPEDEEKSPYNGIVCYWGTNNRNLLFDILYDAAEQNEIVCGIPVNSEQAETILNQSKRIWRLYNRYLNKNLSPQSDFNLNQAVSHQFRAVESFKQNDLEGLKHQLETVEMALERISKEQTAQISSLEHSPSATFELMQNYPNPFNNETLIKFSLDQPGAVVLRIYNVTGQEVKKLLSEFRHSGNYEVIWNATDNQGQPVASGIYFYQLEFAGQFQKREAILLK